MRDRLIEEFKGVCCVCLRLQSASRRLNIHLNHGRVLTLYNQQAKGPLQWAVIHHKIPHGAHRESQWYCSLEKLFLI